jgi:S-adenosylmethionine synthetase
MILTRLHAAEFVFPGHPDKLSDAIADALVLEASRRERRAMAGVEVAVHRNRVFLTGRVACQDAAGIDSVAIVRDVYRTAGYGEGWYPAPEDLVVDDDLCRGPLEDGEEECRVLSDDQAICVGYANDLPQTNHLPVEHWLARHLARRLCSLRREDPALELGPDGKVLVLLREDGPSWSLEGLSCSLQQRAEADDVASHRAVRLAVGDELKKLSERLPGLSSELPDQLTVNGVGAFEVGGPEGDNGLSGKKLVMDAYGPRVPIGGGAWSGKDFFKADRAGGLHARRLAKLIVKLGLATEVRVTLHWFPGDRDARVLEIATPEEQGITGTGIMDLVDRSLLRSGENFQGSDLVEIARWGHFARADYPWERIEGI